MIEIETEFAYVDVTTNRHKIAKLLKEHGELDIVLKGKIKDISGDDGDSIEFEVRTYDAEISL